MTGAVRASPNCGVMSPKLTRWKGLGPNEPRPRPLHWLRTVNLGWKSPAEVHERPSRALVSPRSGSWRWGSDDVPVMIRDAQRNLVDLASQRGLDLASLGPSEAVDIMIHWYETTEAVDAAPHDEDGDALLFQSGSFAFEHPRTFQYDITRQLISSDGDDQVVWQLSLTLHYEPTPESENLRGDTGIWCFAKADIPTWRVAVQTSAATSYVAQHRILRAAVTFDQAC
jgi:hypothetical protein